MVEEKIDHDPYWTLDQGSYRIIGFKCPNACIHNYLDKMVKEFDNVHSKVYQCKARI